MPHLIDQKRLTILLLGSSGFIGQHVKQYLQSMQNSQLALRLPTREQVDFINPDWDSMATLLEDVQVVINMVGIMSHDPKLLEQVHHHTPVKLATMAKELGVKRWINLSALGASSTHEVAFVGSKGRGDKALMQLADGDETIENTHSQFQVFIARPSLVFGRGGASCELFLMLAKFPILPLPNAGRDKVQPVHVEDVAQGLVNLALNSFEIKLITSEKQNLSNNQSRSAVINFTGNEISSVADYLIMMRTCIHDKPAQVILSVPKVILNLATLLIRPIGLVTSINPNIISQDSLKLLQAGSVADAQPFMQLLGRTPLGYTQFDKVRQDNKQIIR